ncbi:glycosyltransferase family 2 protein [Desulfoferrobacter suflitae]|uniref:glycosyltransferase family 2 protein n=1 Tax=Desulfoferrobacter suflitae TaxID=2865782 RepID=UPI0021648445|nr:glycosyltransferase family 2 protein [Desulfoferrobacter suflitae]MCK8600536.1 glycosyltransferase family 2 protein [Desulfoferrobacter suflitae]
MNKVRLKGFTRPVPDSPLVSIIIPTYNYACYLPTALQSCFTQTHKNIEVIVVDDGSTDDTRRRVVEFKDRVHYHYQPNRGVSAARNKGLDLASGEYINFLDADDYLTEDSIAARLKILVQHEDIGVVVSNSYRQREPEAGGTPGLTFKPKVRRDIISDRFYEHLLLQEISFATCTALLRGTLARRFRFPTDITNGEDIAYFSKIFFCARVYYLANPTAVVVKHPDSLRQDIKKIRDQDLALVHTIFDDPLYGGKLDYLRKTFTSLSYLSLAGSFYRAADKKLARKYYRAGIKHKPRNILRVNALSKFLRSYL